MFLIEHRVGWAAEISKIAAELLDFQKWCRLSPCSSMVGAAQAFCWADSSTRIVWQRHGSSVSAPLQCHLLWLHPICTVRSLPRGRFTIAACTRQPEHVAGWLTANYLGNGVMTPSQRWRCSNRWLGASAVAHGSATNFNMDSAGNALAISNTGEEGMEPDPLTLRRKVREATIS